MVVPTVDDPLERSVGPRWQLVAVATVVDHRSIGRCRRPLVDAVSCIGAGGLRETEPEAAVGLG